MGNDCLSFCLLSNETNSNHKKELYHKFAKIKELNHPHDINTVISHLRPFIMQQTN